ncbi:MAG: hypothetical protein GY760_10530, partial [Deltaproteobacteria bacterium]|nr:hypothetical protein [Deltaproteobacteria bacterium]
MAQLLEEVFSFKDKGASAPKPYHQVKIVENDKIDDLSEILQTNVKKVQTAYYKPVNEKGPNGVKEKGSKGIVLKPDKIFYYPFEKIIDKKLNIHKVFSVYTSIKCMYGPDEPMKNRYILFWETNENGDDFKENRNGSAFGINGDSKPIGLGVTDSDGFLNGKSLKWFTSDDNNITFNNGKFPDHAKEKEICFVCKMQEPSDNYRIKPKLKLEKPEKMSNEDKIYKQLHGITKYHYTKIGSEFRHNLIKNAPLHDIGYGDFIWAKKVSRFNRNRKYSFMALPVDIMNQDTFNSISLFEKDPAFKKFVKTVIPKEINESLNSRQFLLINKPAVESKHKELMDFQNHEKSNK